MTFLRCILFLPWKCEEFGLKTAGMNETAEIILQKTLLKEYKFMRNLYAFDKNRDFHRSQCEPLNNHVFFQTDIYFHYEDN